MDKPTIHIWDRTNLQGTWRSLCNVDLGFPHPYTPSVYTYLRDSPWCPACTLCMTSQDKTIDNCLVSRKHHLIRFSEKERL